ncbi:MAG TPA: hypothetical protein HPQ03_17640 [Deltaproteobacteria bacterium]|nr:hypothetical protein [Deltaproteobacteria bacterium]
MKILYTSDIHTSDNLLSDVLAQSENHAVDAVIIGGDLIPRQIPKRDLPKELKAQDQYIENTLIPQVMRFKEKSESAIYLDLSNFDFSYPRRLLEQHQGRLYRLLHMQKHPLTQAVDIIGYMMVPPTPFKKKDWEKIDSMDFPYPKGNRVLLKGVVSDSGGLQDTIIDLASHDTIESDLSELEHFIDKPFIFVAHAPPYETPLDMTGDGRHVGSLSIRQFIKKWSQKGLLLASLHGHIHESPMVSGSVATRIHDAISINPGQNHGPNAELRYVLLELSDDHRTPTVKILLKP